jgi:hypothetical protein
MVLFDLEKHRYKELGGADLTSVTRVISKYYEEFDTEVISARVAKKRGVSQESLKAE